ncbi:MAG TPA: two-component sensor histidine kinase, partial [Clostridium sp.]|nr:two-component sensor histidine kinase [Clostridium sp.]
EQFNIYPNSGSFLIDLTNSNEIAMASTGKPVQSHAILGDFNVVDKSGNNLSNIEGYRCYSVYTMS